MDRRLPLLPFLICSFLALNEMIFGGRGGPWVRGPSLFVCEFV